MTARSSNTDQKDFAAYVRVEPFTRMKNKWIEGFGFEAMRWWCNEDPRTVAAVNGQATAGNVSACSRLRIQDHGDGGRQTLFNFSPAGTTGRGLNDFTLLGMGYRIGPYWLRLLRVYQDYNFENNTPAQGVDAKGRDFLIAHDMFLWSPKGFLTGDSTIPGSVLFGTHFERTDVSCGRSNCATGGEFSRNRILLREWDLWYFLPNRISIGGSVLWYDASNLQSGRTNAQENLGCSGAGRLRAARQGLRLDRYEPELQNVFLVRFLKLVQKGSRMAPLFFAVGIVVIWICTTQRMGPKIICHMNARPILLITLFAWLSCLYARNPETRSYPVAT